MHPERLEQRHRISRAQKEIIFRHILRFQSLWDLAKAHLRTSFFDPVDEIDLETVWRAAKIVVKQSGDRLPEDSTVTWAFLAGQVQAIAECQSERVTPQLLSWIVDPSGLLDRWFSTDAGLNEDSARALLLLFFQEKEVFDPLCAVISSIDTGKIPERLPEMLKMLQNRDSAISSSTKRTARSAAPLDYVRPSIVPESTGLSYFDDLMNGGDVGGEVYGILGANGSGKTLTAVQSAFAKSLVYQHAHDTAGKSLRTCHIFHYEAGYDEIMTRLLSCAAKVKFDRLSISGLDHLSRRGNLNPYEKELFRKEIAQFGIANVDGEYERVMQARCLLNRNIKLHDFSGSDDPSVGVGYVEEIARSLAYEVRHHNDSIGSVYIDYVGLCCRRHLLHNQKDVDRLFRHSVTNFADACHKQIAKPFNCRVWLFHQLSGEANRRQFGARLTHADSAESKSFGENLWFVFILGPRHPKTDVLELQFSKARRAPGMTTPPLLKMRGDINMMEIAADFTVDQVQGVPIAKAETLGSVTFPIVSPSIQPSSLAPIDTAEIIDLDGY